MPQGFAPVNGNARSGAARNRRNRPDAQKEGLLTDLALEAEAATWLGFRLAHALDRADSDEAERLLLRIGTAVGKYWNCKRVPGPWSRPWP